MYRAIRDGVTPVLKFASFSRYSMPKTESNLPIENASSSELNGAIFANACSTITRVSFPDPP